MDLARRRRAAAAATSPIEDTAEAEATRQRTVTAMAVASTAQIFAVMIAFQVESETWRLGFPNDPAGQARLQGIVMSIGSVTSFFISPILGGLSDSFGRKRVMLVTPVACFCTSVVLAASPTVWAAALQTLYMPLTMCWWNGESACLSDMFEGDATAYGAAMSHINAGGSIAHIFSPLVTFNLAARSIRLPYIVAAALCAMNVAIGTVLLRETLPPEKRVPLRWSATNPLSFLGLWHRGGKPLRLLALYNLWAAVGGQETRFVDQQIHRQELTGWSLQQRGTYESLTGLLGLPASFLSVFLLRVLGPRGALALGTGVGLFDMFMQSLATKLSHLYMLSPLSLFYPQSNIGLAQSFLTAGVATASNYPMGEMQGALSNLSTMAGIPSPLTWGWIFQLGVRNNRPEVFYLVGAACGLVQLLICEALCRSIATVPVPEPEPELR